MYDRITKYSFTKKLSLLFIALCALWQFSPYFSWETYNNGILNSIAGIGFSMIFAIFAIITLVITTPIIKLPLEKKGLFLLGFTTLIFLLGICGLDFKSFFSFGIWLSFILIILLVYQDIEYQKKVFEYFSIIIAILLIPSLLFYVLSILGIDLHDSIILPSSGIKTARGVYYLHFPLAIQAVYPYEILANYRFNGIFDEPGVVGTITALLLTGNKFQLKRKWYNIIFLITGILSFSVSFYVLIAAYFVVVNVLKRNVKAAISLLVVLSVYFIFININFDNNMISMIQERLSFNSSGLAGNNRTNEAFERLFSEFLNEDMITVMLGKGHGAIESIVLEQSSKLSAYSNDIINVSSWKSMIYNYGIMGFTLFLAFIINVARCFLKESNSVENKIYIFAFTVCYVLNLYQRPSTFHVGYMLILIGGCAFIALDERNGERKY